MQDHDQFPTADETRGAELYPELSNIERREAMANLRRYFEIALAIAEEKARQDRDLTQPDSVPTVKERSKVHFNL